MKMYPKCILISLMLFMFVQVGAPTSDKEKKIETRSDPGSAGDPQQVKEKEQKDVDKQETSNKESQEESLENQNKEQTDASLPSPTKLPVSPSPTTTAVNCTSTNNSKECEEEGVKPSLKQMLTSMVTENKGMLTRTLYVLIGVTLIVVVYYVMRAIR